MNTQDTRDAKAPESANTPDDAQLSDEELGKVNAGVGGSGLGPFGALIFALFRRPAPPPSRPTTPLHPDDPGDGSAWKNLPNRGGHYDG